MQVSAYAPFLQKVIYLGVLVDRRGLVSKYGEGGLQNGGGGGMISFTHTIRRGG